MALSATGIQREQFARLLEEHRKIVFKVANTYARLADDRADLAQEISTQLWRAFPGYDETRSFSTWMYRIALNVAISHLRASRQRDARNLPYDESVHDDALVDGIAEPDERVRDLHRFIEQLDALNRALLILLLEERSYREIAEILGLSETNVATRISRLKQRIRNDHSAKESQDRGNHHAI
ncbi:MAG TPA: sigma-70 family RNA polymerase sigma factor [Dokdonella sp.]|uniref:RNA polymerase sigma factor n=1 Tax=Dokdonella sp. TaxID=2291710 RepID=UPI002D7E95C2|nr:sigma-70 family RNA polymerase sigma factor [Dokdonella sp.]HET9031384.1 sigma-70 family RNA polymerase sigma factor [Dokdonella sp.]